MFLMSSFLMAQSALTDWDSRQDTVHINISVNDTLITIDMNALFGKVGNETLKPIGFFTDSTMTSTSVTFKVYNEYYGTYFLLKDHDGSAHSVTVSGAEYYPFKPTLFAGVQKFQMEFGSAEAADRVISIVGRVY